MPMKLSAEGLRKAAVLVSSLDTAAADAVLDQLSSEQAQQVREILIDMDEVDQKEQRRVIDEFFHTGPVAPVKAPPGIELEGRLAWMHSHDSPIPSNDEPADARPTIANPFAFLHEAEADKLARILTDERPQMIALVLSHLAPERAGGVLALLPEALQVEVIHRLVDLEETDPEILREVEEVLRSRLSRQVQVQRRRVAGIQAVAGILHASNGQVGMQILDNLSSRDSTLADKLGPRQYAFDELFELGDRVLAELFDTAGPALMMPALLGAPPPLVNRLLAVVPAADARAIRQQLKSPGPIRLSDVDEARREIARIASRLNYRVTHNVVRAA